MILETEVELRHLLELANGVSEVEREMIARFSGQQFDPERMALECYHYQGPKWVGVDDDKPVAAGGLILLRPGVFRTWFLHTPDTWRYRSPVTEICRNAIDGAFAALGAHRIECLTPTSNSVARRWYGKLGLQFECILGGFMSSGEDAAVYVRRS